MGWFNRLLAGIFHNGGRPSGRGIDAEAEVAACLYDQVVPALKTVEAQLASEGYETSLRHDGAWAQLSVTNYNGLALAYTVRGHVYKEPVRNLSSLAAEDSLKRFARIEIESGGRRREHRLQRCRRSAIERAALSYYRRFLMKTPLG